MRRPGEGREIEGWHAFVHVMRHRWWVLVIAVVGLALGFAIQAWLAASTGCTFDGDTVMCREVPGQAVIAVLAMAMIGGSVGMVSLLFGQWLALRVGAYQQVACPSCSREAGPIHEHCRGWLIAKGRGDVDVVKARRHLAWHSIFPRLFTLAILVAIIGIGVAAYGISIPHQDDLDDCSGAGVVGETRRCSNEDTSGRVWWIGSGMMAFITAVGVLSFAFTYRMVYPRFQAEDLGRPPGLA